MGDMVGELQFGVKVSPDEFKKLFGFNYDDYGDADVEASTVKKVLPPGLILNQPYETEESFIIVEESHKQAFNGSDELGDLTALPYQEWKKKVEDFLKAHNIRPLRPPQWYLVGRYN